MTDPEQLRRRSSRRRTPNSRYTDADQDLDIEQAESKRRRVQNQRNRPRDIDTDTPHATPKRSRTTQNTRHKRNRTDSDDETENHHITSEKAPQPTPTEQLQIMAINCGGRLYKYRQLIHEYVSATHPDILVLSETGLDDYHAGLCKVYATVSGYTWYHLTNSEVCDGRNRAISLLVQDKWLAFVAKVDPERDLCAFHISLRIDKWNIALLAIYGEPDAPPKYWEQLDKWISKTITPADRTIIIGDLNIAPDPQIDRYTHGDTQHRPTEATRIFKRILEQHQLEDIWRVTHGGRQQYTYRARRQDENAQRPMSRIDLALTSVTMHDNITSCEILSGYGELTADHEPIEVTVRLPRAIPNIEANTSLPPETCVTEIQVRGLRDYLTKYAYQEAFTDELLATIQNTPITQAAYTAFQDLVLDIARTRLGTYERVINKQSKKRRAPNLIELTLGRCNTVLCSEAHLLREVKNGATLRRTTAIESLVRNAPSGFSIPLPPQTR